jgi:hypothetical protein
MPAAFTTRASQRIATKMEPGTGVPAAGKARAQGRRQPVHDRFRRSPQVMQNANNLQNPCIAGFLESKPISG